MSDTCLLRPPPGALRRWGPLSLAWLMSVGAWGSAWAATVPEAPDAGRAGMRAVTPRGTTSPSSAAATTATTTITSTSTSTSTSTFAFAPAPAHLPPAPAPAPDRTPAVLALVGLACIRVGAWLKAKTSFSEKVRSA